MRLLTLVIIIAIIVGGLYYAHQKGYIGKAGQAVESSFTLHFSRGQKLYNQMKYEEAIAELERAYELEPNHTKAPDALRRIGDCYKELKKPDDAIASYERCIEKFPDYHLRGDVEKAIELVKALGYY